MDYLTELHAALDKRLMPETAAHHPAAHRDIGPGRAGRELARSPSPLRPVLLVLHVRRLRAARGAARQLASAARMFGVDAAGIDRLTRLNCVRS